MASPPETTSQRHLMPKTTRSRYTSLFRRRKPKRDAQNLTLPTQPQMDTRYLSDDISLLRRASVATANTNAARYRVRKDIQSHIPDWIDDVVHAQLVEIADRLSEQVSLTEVIDILSPSFYEPEFEREAELEQDRPGSDPSFFTTKPGEHRASPRSSTSISRPSLALPSLDLGPRSIVSPIESTDAPYFAHVESATVARHPRNLSSSSGSSSRSGDTATSVYSTRSSVTSPGVSDEDRTSDQLSNRMTVSKLMGKTLPMSETLC
jgi:hypothetical protein